MSQHTEPPPLRSRGPPSRSPAACARTDSSAASASLLWHAGDEQGQVSSQCKAVSTESEKRA
eukprot:5448932-Prymnesium_polylepis.1